MRNKIIFWEKLGLNVFRHIIFWYKNDTKVGTNFDTLEDSLIKFDFFLQLSDRFPQNIIYIKYLVRVNNVRLGKEALLLRMSTRFSDFMKIHKNNKLY